MSKISEQVEIVAKHLCNPHTPIIFKFFDPFHGLGSIGEKNWGYSREDAVVINTDDDTKGFQMEYIFAEERSRMECIHCYNNACYVKVKRISQKLIRQDGKCFDVLTFKVYLFTQGEKLKEYYQTECWFDITNFFNKDPK